ncbi:hypothetical protein NPIL_52081 [Nephila pilipes]|uniref:Uncharacterized protein n=1 Tax=Nephila pilipes TaxID=299642 RepID=A0A8X6TQH9_NEPPI|nr:hypothetical protein NPIL_52081 [Nephila pilipes]
MDRKKVCEKSSAKKKMMSIELKREIIEKHEQHTEVMQEIGFEESEEEVISTSEIKEILGMWERVSQFVKRNTQKKLQQVVHLIFLMTLA